MAHDRLSELHFFLHQIEQNYHDPQLFRYYLNGYLASLNATLMIVARELEAIGLAGWWKQRKRAFLDDPVISKFKTGRNITTHQRAIYEGSSLSSGLFRNRTMKFAISHADQSDRSTQDVLHHLQSLDTSLFVDPHRAALGEQLGVRREYFISELSLDEHALLAIRRAFARMTTVLEAAHEQLSLTYTPVDESEYVANETIDPVVVLLESDMDPGLIEKWNW